MTGHTRLSPGIELHEIDRSAYNQQIDTASNTVVSLFGFADMGLDYDVQAINSLQQYHNTYGYPRNEVECYLYNGACEVLNRGGVCLVTKLPYANASKDKYAAIDYKVKIDSESDIVSAGKVVDNMKLSVDSSLTSYAEITQISALQNLISMEQLDEYRTSNCYQSTSGISKNMIRIVDITRSKYGKINMISGSAVEENVQCLGIVPVIVGAANAMPYQDLFQLQTSSTISGHEFTENLSDYQPVVDFASRDRESLSAYESTFSTKLQQDTIEADCVSRTACRQFPAIKFIGRSAVEKKCKKYVTVCVFEAYADQANENRLAFRLVETYSGSLDPNSRDEQTGASDYVCNMVNANSSRINMFASVKPNDLILKKAETFLARQKAYATGFTDSECLKTISYKDSIVDPLTKMFDRMQDPNIVPIDIIADCGMSNVAQFVKHYGNTSPCDVASYPFFIDADGRSTHLRPSTDTDITAWRAVINKFDGFCKSYRKDCLFIADGVRHFVLDGNEKIVRYSKPENTIRNSIMPNVRNMQGPDSSYSAGYCNWFMIADQYSGDRFWCPPSIKAAGACIYSDIQFHPWSAPAGLIRGVVRDAYDVSFNPMNDQAGQMYQQAWNYAVAYPINGIVIEGQKTFQIQQTALDRVNVRRLLLWLEKRVIAVARYFLYEGNNEYNRQRFVDTISPIFEEAKNGDGIRDYVIRCDDALNTDVVIDNNEMRCQIALIPIKSIEWIVIDFTVLSQSASVTEEIMK